MCVWPCSWTCEIALLDLKLLLFAKIIYESFNFLRSLWQLDGLVHYWFKMSFNGPEHIEVLLKTSYLIWVDVYDVMTLLFDLTGDHHDSWKGILVKVYNLQNIGFLKWILNKVLSRIIYNLPFWGQHHIQCVCVCMYIYIYTHTHTLSLCMYMSYTVQNKAIG